MEIVSTIDSTQTQNQTSETPLEHRSDDILKEGVIINDQC